MFLLWENGNGVNEPLSLHSTALLSTSLDELRIYGAKLCQTFQTFLCILSPHFDLRYLSVKSGLQANFYTQTEFFSIVLDILHSTHKHNALPQVCLSCCYMRSPFCHFIYQTVLLVCVVYEMKIFSYNNIFERYFV